MLYVPSGHSSHLAEPADEANLPAVQVEHTESCTGNAGGSDKRLTPKTQPPALTAEVGA